MPTGDPVHTHGSGTGGEESSPRFTASSLCFQRNPVTEHATCPADGASTYLALTFGTLLSSQGTNASFVLTLSGFPPGVFPSVSPTLSDLSDPMSSAVSAFQVPARAFPFPAAPTLSELPGRSYRLSIPMRRGLLVENQSSQEASRCALCRRRGTSPTSRQLRKSTSPPVPCQRSLWGE